MLSRMVSSKFVSPFYAGITVYHMTSIVSRLTRWLETDVERVPMFLRMYSARTFEHSHAFSNDLLVSPVVQGLVLFFVGISSSVRSGEELVGTTASSRNQFRFSMRGMCGMEGLVPGLTTSSMVVYAISTPT